jgi:hypothetical protein
MLNSYAQWCTAVKDRDLVQAFPQLNKCNATPSEIVTIDIGLNFADMLPFPIKDSFLPVVRDPNGAVCNAGSRGCPCVVVVNNTRAAAATVDAMGECSFGLECRNLTCIGVADKGFADEAKLRQAYGGASAIVPSIFVWLGSVAVTFAH